LRRPLAFAATLAALLTLASPAGAHVITKTPYVYASATNEIELETPNEQSIPMTRLHVVVPADFRIVGAQSQGDWTAETTSTEVTWTGGELASLATETFTLTVEAPAGPGPASLEATQHYAGGGSIGWPVALTVLPAAEPSQQLDRALVVGIVGLLVLTALGILVWRRRGAARQDR
jgi:hypothetical protein